eukprot:9594565-Lingulodinium_polyedra.AAC.1
MVPALKHAEKAQVAQLPLFTDGSGLGAEYLGSHPPAEDPLGHANLHPAWAFVALAKLGNGELRFVGAHCGHT